MEPSVDRLAVVCRILLDERVCTLRKEVEKLQLELFWKDHDVEALNRAMAYANDGQWVVCECYACLRVRLYWPDDSWIEDKVQAVQQRFPPPASSCTFKPRFDACIAKHGLTAMYMNGGEFYQSCMTHRNEAGFHDVDCHFIMCSTSFRCLSFGRKFYQKSSRNDPELVKLSNLAKELRDPDKDFKRAQENDSDED